jgi:hypothetical protein
MGASSPEFATVALPWSFHASTDKEEMEGSEEEVLLCNIPGLEVIK